MSSRTSSPRRSLPASRRSDRRVSFLRPKEQRLRESSYFVKGRALSRGARRLVGRRGGVGGDQIVAQHARFLARRLGGEPPQQREQRLDVAQGLLRATGEHPLDHAAPEIGGSTRTADEAALA